jgi:hypothetical protein
MILIAPASAAAPAPLRFGAAGTEEAAMPGPTMSPNETAVRYERLLRDDHTPATVRYVGGERTWKA